MGQGHSLCPASLVLCVILPTGGGGAQTHTLVKKIIKLLYRKIVNLKNHKTGSQDAYRGGGGGPSHRGFFARENFAPSLFRTVA